MKQQPKNLDELPYKVMQITIDGEWSNCKLVKREDVRKLLKRRIEELRKMNEEWDKKGWESRSIVDIIVELKCIMGEGK